MDTTEETHPRSKHVRRWRWREGGGGGEGDGRGQLKGELFDALHFMYSKNAVILVAYEYSTVALWAFAITVFLMILELI